MAAALLACSAGVGRASMIQGPVEELDPGEIVTLDRLLPGGDLGAVQVGDKLFSEFSYSPTGEVPNPDRVNVAGFTDVDGNYGLQFSGGFFDLPGDGASDALIGFTVGVSEEGLAAGYLISGVNLAVGGVGIGPGSFALVDEGFDITNLGIEAGESSIAGGPPVVIPESNGSIAFDEPVSRLRVTKDIILFTGDDSAFPARISEITQTFEQVRSVVPEPSAAILLCSLLGYGFAGHRRR